MEGIHMIVIHLVGAELVFKEDLRLSVRDALLTCASILIVAVRGQICQVQQWDVYFMPFMGHFKVESWADFGGPVGTGKITQVTLV